MAVTPDGLLLSKPPGGVGILVSLVVIAAGFAVGFAYIGVLGFGIALVGGLMLWNQWGSIRIRCTVSKLLVEEQGHVRGFLIGPSRFRIPWGDVKTVAVAGDAVAIEHKGGTARIAAGAPKDELDTLAEKIRTAVQRAEP